MTIKLKVHLECFLFSQRKGLHALDHFAVLSLAHFHRVFALGEYLRAKVLAVYSEGIDNLPTFFLHHLHDLVGLIYL